ncbi:MAG: class I SAM-dependent methyltransferase [PVC group bacterium]|nr:class I SAM-dependent methyltransferase [PVC group bacterium]
MAISTTWGDYFKNHHEGLGSTYERFILHGYFEDMKNKYGIENVLETPSFGMTGVSGINSLWWVAKKIPVTITDFDEERIHKIKDVWQEVALAVHIEHCAIDNKVLPFDDKAFDLSWNFAALWYISKLDNFLRELSRVSRKVIFICIPNKSNVFCKMRMKDAKQEGIPYPEHIDANKIKSFLKNLGWNLQKQGYLDTPWWPDIAMKKEELLAKIGIKPKKDSLGQNDYLCILDYFSGKNPQMEIEIMKHSWLENSPYLIQKLWAHHQYLIFAPKESKK